MTRSTEKLIRVSLRDGCREHCDALIDELRRLSAENERIWPLAERVLELKAQCDALLEAAQGIVDFVDGPAEAKRPDVFFLRISKARAAIKAVEEGK